MLKTVDKSPPLATRTFWSQAVVVLLVGCAIVLAVGFGLFKWVIWPELERWQPQVEGQISKALGSKVTIGSIEPSFSGFYPSLTVRNVQSAGAEISLDKVDMEFSPRALLSRKILFRNLQLESGQIRVEIDKQGLWRLAGLAFDPKNRTAMTPELERQFADALNWILSQRQIALKNVLLKLVNPNEGRTDSILVSSIALENQGRNHKLSSSSKPGGEFFSQWRTPAAPSAYQIGQWEGQLNWVMRGKEPGSELSGETLAYLLRTTQANTNLPLLEQIAGLTLKSEITGQFSKGIFNEASLAKVSLNSEPLSMGFQTDLISLTRVEGQDFLLSTPSLRLKGTQQLASLDVVTKGVAKLGFHWGSEKIGANVATPTSAEVSLGAFDLGTLRRALEFWGKAQKVVDLQKLASRIEAQVWDLQGSLKSARLSWSDAKGELSGEIDAIGLSLLSKQPDRPGFSQLNGKVGFSRAAANEDVVGTYELSGKQAHLILPGVLAESQIALDQIDSQGEWRWFRRAETNPEYAFELKTQRLAFANRDAQGQLAGIYKSSREEKNPGFIDMQGTFSRGDGLRIASYLPVKISEGVRSWVSNAIRAGNTSDGKFKVKGKLLDFPFRDPADGDFNITTQISNARVEYAPNWPSVDKIEGELVVDRGGLSVNGRSGEILGVAVNNVKVDIPELRNGIVQIDGVAKGSASKMLEFVNISPLKTLTIASQKTAVKEFMTSLQVEGPAELTLAVTLPILNLPELKVQGQVKLLDGSLKSIHTPDMTAVSGNLSFDEQGLKLDAIQGSYASGGRLVLSGVSDRNSPLALKVSGLATATAVRDLPFMKPLASVLAYFEGIAPFESTIDLVNGELVVQLASDLKGMAVALPLPAGKSADTTRAMNLSYTAKAIELKLAADSLGNSAQPNRDAPSIRMMLSRQEATPEYAWTGGLRVGFESPDQLPPLATDGIAAILQVPTLDATAWRDWIRKTFSPPAGTVAKAKTTQADPIIGIPAFVMNGSVLAVVQAAIVSDLVTFEDMRFANVVAGNSFQWAPSRIVGAEAQVPLLMNWLSSMKSNKAEGFVRWQAEGMEGRVIARLTSLNWPLNYEAPLLGGAPATPLAKSPPLDYLPSIALDADRFDYRGIPLGALMVRGDSVDLNNAYEISQLSVKRAGYEIGGSVKWDRVSNESVLDLAITTTDTGLTFAGLGYNDIVKDAAGTLNGALRWPGRPDRVDLNIMSGDMQLNVGRGQFLKTDIGAARVLSLVSAQGFLRRLNLDFRDMTDKGYSFDSISGPIKVTKGIALMDNVAIRSTLAQISFKGSLGLEDKTQELRARVLPEINAGGASIVYAAVANPALGLGSFLVQYLFRRPLQEIFALEYDITGKWEDPVIKEVKRASRASGGAGTP
jgi:uncharacterized protein (TIGR02099 family)